MDEATSNLATYRCLALALQNLDEACFQGADVEYQILNLNLVSGEAFMVPGSRLCRSSNATGWRCTRMLFKGRVGAAEELWIRGSKYAIAADTVRLAPTAKGRSARRSALCTLRFFCSLFLKNYTEQRTL